MAYPTLTFPSELNPTTRKELEQLVAQLQGLFATAGIQADGRFTAPVVINPTGSMIEIAQETVPDGWLLCDGRDVLRATYPALWRAIGTKFGAGNGTTTFTLPNRSALHGPAVASNYIIKT